MATNVQVKVKEEKYDFEKKPYCKWTIQAVNVLQGDAILLDLQYSNTYVG